MLSFPYLQFLQTSKIFRNYVFAILIGLFLAKLIGSLFFVADDIRRGALVLMNKIFPLSGAQYMGPEGQGIPRSTFLSWLGVGLASSLFISLIYGFGNVLGRCWEGFGNVFERFWDGVGVCLVCILGIFGLTLMHPQDREQQIK